MELVELIHDAQDAMDRGDYAIAAAACSHALATYPSCFSAHRMLAEAYLEQGQTDVAIEHFERTLTIDPLNVLARLGLGVAAEEKREMGDAYAAYLHAWEINPALDQVRDELVRLRGLLGGGERLHPTRAGLAGIFARGGQFGRAAAEWRAVLMVEPENRRARTSLAEVLWRSGDDLPAAAICREALDEYPENARALAMLAEVEQRRGGPTAEGLIERYQAVDPLAEVATLLGEWRDGVDVGFLHSETASLPDFDPSTATMPEPDVAAAPAKAPSGLAGGHFAAPDLWDTLVRDFSDDPHAPRYAGPGEADVQPFSWLDEGSSAPDPDVEPFSLDALLEQHRPAPADPPMAFTQQDRGPSTDNLSLGADIAAFEPATIPVAPAAPPPPPPALAAEPAPRAESAPAVDPSAFAAQPAAANPFVSADGRVDLTVGWDDLDRQLQEATPKFDNAAEMDALAAQLGVAGIAPFEMEAAPFDESAWAPFTADDLNESSAAPPATRPADPAPTPFLPPAAPVAPAFVAEPTPTAPAPAEEEAFDLGWDLDQELVSAIPAPQSSGYTEMLRHVDTELPQEINLGPEVDPFANPDSAGVPLAFEDLLAVTSRDGTAPLRAPADLVEAIEPSPPFDDLSALYALESAEALDAVAPDLPLDESPLGLEELLRGDGLGAEQGDLWESIPGSDAPAASAWEPLAEQPAAMLGEVDDLGFEAELDGLRDLQPFSLDDADVFATEAEVAIDFSDINEAPFDPAELAPLDIPSAPPAFELAEAVPWSDGSPAATSEAIGEEANGATWDEVTFAEVAQPVPAFPAAVVSERRDAVGLGVPGGVAWPAFVNHTSELIDRGLAAGNVFARLREAKRAASAAGLLQVDRSVRDLRRTVIAAPPIEERVQVYSVPAAGTGSSPLNGAARHGSSSESHGIDLMALRVQLIEDASSAGEVAERLEGAVQHGLNDPLALRVLGEAYLKLGRTEQAAAQFRQAMLTRRRAR